VSGVEILCVKLGLIGGRRFVEEGEVEIAKGRAAVRSRRRRSRREGERR